MNPLAVAAAFGFAKGLFTSPTSPLGGWKETVVSPLMEETMFRHVPLSYGSTRLPEGWTALPFAMEHVSQEHRLHGLHTGAASAFSRFADVFLGGVMYEKAYRQFGFWGAVAAHVGHNLAHGLGARTARRVRRVRGYRP